MKEKLDLHPRLSIYIPTEEREIARISFVVSNQIYDLMQKRGL